MPANWPLPGEGGSASFEPATVGLHDAVVAEYEDLGELEDRKGRKNRYGRFVFQLAETEKDGTRKEATFKFPCYWGRTDERPSKIRKALEHWKGAPMTKEEMESFDPQKVVGRPCIVAVIHVGPYGEYKNMYAVVETIHKAGAIKLSVTPDYKTRAERRAAKDGAQANIGGANGPALPDDDCPF